jgi:hypothetical protein
MQYFTTLLTLASMATSALSGVVAVPKAHDVLAGDVRGPSLASVVPHPDSKLDERGVPIGCLAGVFSLLTINRIGRVDIQSQIDHLNTWAYDSNRNIHVNLDFTRTYEPIREVRFAIRNRSQFISNALILSNYRDTLIDHPRHTVRILIPRAQGVSMGEIAPTTYSGCVDLPELDGTWYVQLER